MRIGYMTFMFLLLVAATATSCKKNRYMVNTSSIKVDIKIKRLEKDLFTLNPDEVIPLVPALRQKYDGFLQLFSLVINTGDINETSFGDLLLRFCSDKQNNEVFALTMKKYPDIKHVEEELREAFRHYLFYFPERRVPAVFTCITGFNNSIIAGDSLLGIGLDRYLGADCEYYPRLSIYKYMSDRMTPENIVPDCMYGWGASEWEFSALKYQVDNVLAEIIHNGKLKYFEKCMLPETSDEIIFGFTPGQMKFCRNNENQMWQYLVEHNLLFSSDQLAIRKLTGEAPFTSYFTRESPGQAAIWLGFRIIESYMINNPGIKMEDMIKNTDVQGILEKAKYSPQ
ncbi:MAG: hypothetical protein WA816_11360 [Bacteroidales bacterium]